jgi:hypothetical protein
MESQHIIFIHGLSNKPSPKDLRRIWLEALSQETDNDSGLNLGALGINVSFIYWADLFYESPLPSGDYESNYESLASEIEAKLNSSTHDQSNQWIDELENAYRDTFEEEDVEEMKTDDPYEAIPLPRSVKKLFLKKLVREAHAYLFNVNGVKDTIRSRVLEVIKSNDFDNTILVGHSQGSFIAYDVLTMEECPEISGFMTLGSPLGVDEIQKELDWSRDNGFPENLIGDWVNIYDSLDPVSRLDPILANDFKKDSEEIVKDIKEQNWGYWRHSATKYFKGSKLRSELRRLSKRS